MKELKLEVSKTIRPPDYRKTSGLILTACRSFFEKDENEKAYQEWQAERKEKAG